MPTWCRKCRKPIALAPQTAPRIALDSSCFGVPTALYPSTDTGREFHEIDKVEFGALYFLDYATGFEQETSRACGSLAELLVMVSTFIAPTLEGLYLDPRYIVRYLGEDIKTFLFNFHKKNRTFLPQ